MIGNAYLSILFIVTTIVVLSNFNANAQISGKWSADLQPTQGSNATGTATLELQNNGENVQYSIAGNGLSNVTGIAISQEMGSGRTPDVVTLATASQSGIGPGSGSLTGNFTASDLMGPLKDKSMADFVKTINEGKIIFRVNTMAFPLGEIIGNVTAGASNATGTAMNATANATGTAIGQAESVVSTTANATANATGEVMTQTEDVVNLTSDAASNATQTAMDNTLIIASDASSNATSDDMTEANEIISAASNASSNATNATETTMGQAEEAVSSAANATANATEAASNETGNPILDALKNMFGGITGDN
ncbi:MAG TPA: CHRD domain-containing protein [Nitrososphaeraceae archaeon]|nr:CHRD domain-containing protein [Nitrososphaeraceae archaeon]